MCFHKTFQPTLNNLHLPLELKPKRKSPVGWFDGDGALWAGTAQPLARPWLTTTNQCTWLCWRSWKHLSQSKHSGSIKSRSSGRTRCDSRASPSLFRLQGVLPPPKGRFIFFFLQMQNKTSSSKIQSRQRNGIQRVSCGHPGLWKTGLGRIRKGRNHKDVGNKEMDSRVVKFSARLNSSFSTHLPATLSVSSQSMPQHLQVPAHLHLLPPSSPCLPPGTSPQPGKHKPGAAVLPLLLLCLNLLSLKTKLTQWGVVLKPRPY